LHRIDQPELRLDDTRMRLIAAEFGGDAFVELDDVLNRQVANAVSR